MKRVPPSGRFKEELDRQLADGSKAGHLPSHTFAEMAARFMPQGLVTEATKFMEPLSDPYRSDGGSR